MRAAVIVFPGSNCDRDMAVALTGAAGGTPPAMVWHKETVLPAGLDLVCLPGGFSFGDYLRCGAIAARSPIMAAVQNFASAGGHVLGVCNGWQILTEAGLLPGALLRNAGISFLCRHAPLRVETTDSPFTSGYAAGARITLPIAHHDGNFAADDAVMDRLEGEGRIVFRYMASAAPDAEAAAPNGAAHAVAGVLSENRRILGMMPHPERFADAALGGADGAAIFNALAAA